jgi:hypothetical protein
VAGTSAGASVACETRLVSGGSSASHRVGEETRQATIHPAKELETALETALVGEKED